MRAISRFLVVDLLPVVVLSLSIPPNLSNTRYWVIMGAGFLLAMVNYIDGWFRGRASVKL